MVNFTFRGLMAPVFTAFNEDKDRSLNLDVIPKYSDYLKDQGVEGILVNGTLGEGVSQSIEEREANAKAWVRECRRNKQTVMIQVGGVGLPDVRRLAKHAEDLGADAILCLPDLFHQPKSPEDLMHYLEKVSEAAPRTPLLYYHIPGFIGIDVNVRKLLELIKENPNQVPTFVGLKYTHNDLHMGASCLTVDEEKFSVFLGSDTILAAAYCLGFNSAIGTTLNMFTQLNHDIVGAIKNNDVLLARKAQRQLSAAVQVITQHGSWVGTMKAAMNMIAPIGVGPVRDPLLNMSDSQKNIIEKDLKKLGFL